MTLYKSQEGKYSEELLDIVRFIEEERPELNKELEEKYILANRDPFEIPLEKYKGVKFIQLDEKVPIGAKGSIRLMPVYYSDE